MSLGGNLLRVGRHALPAISRCYRLRYWHTNFMQTRLAPHRDITSQSDSSHSPTTPADRLRNSIRRSNVASIHHSYTLATFKARSNLGSDGRVRRSILSEDEVLALLQCLAASGRPNDLALVDQILQDLGPLFHVERTEVFHTAVVHGLIRCGNIQTIYNWIMAMPQRIGRFTTIEHWLPFLEHCLQMREVGMIRQSLKTMQKSGCTPTNQVLKILLRALFLSESRIRDFGQAFEDASREGLSFDPSISILVYDGFAQLRRFNRAVQVQNMYKASFPELSISNRAERQQRIAMEAQQEGTTAAIALCKEFQAQGFKPNERTLTVVLRGSRSAADMHFAEKELGVQSNVIHWSILITNAIRIGDLPGALSLYEESWERQIQPDVAMIQPIINALCFPPLARPSETAIDRAITIYEQLLHSTLRNHPQDGTEPVPQSDHLPSREPPVGGPNAQLYSILLRTLASATNAQKYIPKALTILDDMESYNIGLENSGAVASVTILLLRSSSTYAEAMDVFKRISQSKIGSNLDSKGYIAILNAFCKLAFDRHDVFASLKHYFEIVKEMRRVGYGLTAEVYAIILRQLTHGARSMTLVDLLACIRTVHNRLVLDTSFSPDVALWNQLMDTYQRGNFFLDAHTIWDMMFISGRFDNASVSIILDACTHAKEWSEATKICSNLFRTGFFFNQRNWNGWLECMCQLDHLDEAVQLVCSDFGKEQSHVEPDIESVRILLKFAIAARRKDLVQSRVKQALPDLWARLPADLRK